MMRAVLGVLGLLLLLACGGTAALVHDEGAVGSRPQWHCPTSVSAPVPTLVVADGTPTPSPLPSATPYARHDLFFLGQDIEVGMLRVTVHGVETSGTTHTLDLELGSRTTQPRDLTAQVVLREVERLDGSRERGWWTSTDSALPHELVPGTSWRRNIAIHAPAGRPTLLAVLPTLAQAQRPDVPAEGLVLVRLDGPDPFCAGNVARAPLLPDGAGGTLPGMPISGTPLAVPPGQNALVAFVVAKVGYPYIWGAKGPHGFDCSGLLFAAYASLGITVPVGTTAPGGGQWAATTPVDTASLRPGDFLFFHTFAQSPPPSHVGMYVGDLDGDGRGDMIHAANQDIGVVFQSDVFGSAYWTQHFMGGRRAAGFPY